MLSNILEYYTVNGPYVLAQFGRHFLITFYGVLFACLVGIPVGFFIARVKKLSNWVIGFANIIQTIPSLAMLSILMIGMGLGANTVIMAVFLYSLLPIIKNTYTGVITVDGNLIDVAKAMGMTRRQITINVTLPLALSVILAGARTALVVGVGVSAIGTLIGAGGLGDIITRGISVANGAPIIWAGALPTALMAIASDMGLAAIEKRVNPLSRIRHSDTDGI